jgi:hypothetical protein
MKIKWGIPYPLQGSWNARQTDLRMPEVENHPKICKNIGT